MSAVSRGIAFIVVWTMAGYCLKYGQDWDKLSLFAIIFVTYVVYASCLAMGAK